jgi:L-asparaginase II
MDNPVLVEVTRAGIVESQHRGALVIADARGSVVLELGDGARPIFPRSAVKAFQALPFVESGAADRYGVAEEALALACASHNGEPEHVGVVRETLGRTGLDETCLECGAQLPTRESDRARLARQGARGGSVHNNCSGKHTGFLCLAAHMGVDPAGYVRPDHPAMRVVTAALDDMVGGVLDDRLCGTDGCSIPSYAMPLRALATGFARLGTGEGLPPDRARAAARLRAAVAAHPFMVAGTRRFDTALMTAFGARAFTKTGAEGVFTGALPDLGLGFALKIDDGTTRASEVATAAIVEHFLDLDGAGRAALAPLARPRLKNWNGIHVGDVLPAAALGRALDAAAAR